MKHSISKVLSLWTSTFTITGLIAFGWFLTPFIIDSVEYSEEPYFWRKSFELLVLIIFSIRLLNRRRHSLAELPIDMARYENHAAAVVHNALYMLALIVPIWDKCSRLRSNSAAAFIFLDSMFPSCFQSAKQMPRYQICRPECWPTRF
mgnify:CR=1 FL=1